MTLCYGYLDHHAFMVQIPCPPGFLIQSIDLATGDWFHGRRVNQDSMGINIVKLETSPRTTMSKLWQKWFVLACNPSTPESWARWLRIQEHLKSLTELQLQDFFKEDKPKKTKRPPEPARVNKLTGRPCAENPYAMISVITPNLPNIKLDDPQIQEVVQAVRKRAQEIYSTSGLEPHTVPRDGVHPQVTIRPRNATDD